MSEELLTKDEAKAVLLALTEGCKAIEQVDILKSQLQAAKEKIERYEKALKDIAMNRGMTQLGECCVNKTCNPVYDDGEKVAHCQFAYGVNRGFNECASKAEEALKGAT